MVGLHVAEQPLVVGDQEDGVVVGVEGVDAFGDDAEGVDVEAGVGFVHDGDPGLEQAELEDFGALLLAAGEAVVDVAADELLVHLEAGEDVVEQLAELADGDFGAAAGADGAAEEVDHGDAGDVGGVLEGEEEAGACALVGGEFEHFIAVHADGAAVDGVAGVAHDGVGEGALAGAVGAHDGVDLAGPEGEGEPLHDLLVLDGHAQVVDLEERRHHPLLIRAVRDPLSSWRPRRGAARCIRSVRRRRRRGRSGRPRRRAAFRWRGGRLRRRSRRRRRR